MVAGQAGTELTQLNIESLWSGGPFQSSVRYTASAGSSFGSSSLGMLTRLRSLLFPQTYNGGNKQPSEAATMAADLKTIRQAIFDSPNGTIESKSCFD